MEIRTTRPSNNKYFIRQVSGGWNGAVAGNPTVKGADVLANCVGYANGRFNEIIGKGRCVYQLVCNAENFIEAAKNQGLKISKVPVQGGIMVWQKGKTLSGKDGAGHVAIVEEVYADGSIFTSESGWGSSAWIFKNLHRNNSNGRWGQDANYKFRGCIINPAIGGGEIVPVPPLVVDGIGGVATVSAMQRFFNCPVDGVISGQIKGLQKYYPALTAVSYKGADSACVKALQKWLGMSGKNVDGVLGKTTIKLWQRALGVEADGIFGKSSMKAWQKYLNEKLTPDKKEPERGKSNTADSPTTVKKSSYSVIDVSEFQKTIDWKKVKADGVDGAIIRYGDGTYLDPKFDENMKGAKAAGLHVGCYIFSRAKNAATAESEATRLFNAASKYDPDMPLYIDLEVAKLAKYADTVAAAFIKKMDALGGRPGVYANCDWFTNYLTKTLKNYSDRPMWIAQYNKKITHKNPKLFGMWQYTSKGSVSGIKTRVDLDHCYVEYWKNSQGENSEKHSEPVVEVPVVTAPAKNEYTGKLPTNKLKKTTEQVIADALIFGKWIVGDKRFGYGRMGGKKYKGTKEYSITHSGGCHFCGTNAGKIKRAKKAGLKNPEEWEYTYVCNTFVHACYAHSGVAAMLKASGHAWAASNYEKSKDWKEIKKPSKITDLKPGDVLTCPAHVSMYIGNGKGMEATSGPGGGNSASSKEAWANSIRTCDFAKNFKAATKIFRYVGTVNSTTPIRYGEVSDRVGLLQDYLKFKGYGITSDRIFGDATRDAVKKFQKANGLTVDGIVGPATLAKMAEVK